MYAAVVREFIREQICPICKKGPFKVLPVHTCKAHGIDKWQLRDMAGLTASDRISSPEFCEHAGEVAKDRRERGDFIPTHRKSGKNTNATKAGKQKAIATLLRSGLLNKERFPCGTHAAYARGCRCDACRVAESEYRKTLKSQPEPTP